MKSSYCNNKILPREFSKTEFCKEIESFLVSDESYFIAEKKDSIISKKRMVVNFSITPRFITKINWLLIASIILSVCYMFKVKSHVQDLTFELKQISSQIEQEKSQYSLLKAELSFLKSPERLAKLAAEYLQLEEIKPTQLVIKENSKKQGLGMIKFAALSNKKSNNKWRYKKGPSQVMTASTKQKAF